ncbi:MAG TPA: FG-GAP-like repeat-containing protein [Flavobacteriales bacterium]|nr:FG-GAP-like repeat-containing protein [Flavobacteriales bacterium]
MKKILPLFAAGLLAANANAQGTCATALPVDVGVHAVPTVDGAANTPCYGAAGTGALWYTYSATMDTTMKLVTHVTGVTDVDTKVSVYSGACASLVCIIGDDDAGGNLTSMVTWDVTAGNTYTIAFDNHYSSSTFSFELSYVIPPPPPPQGVVTFTPTTIIGASGIMGASDMDNDGRDDAVMPGYTAVNIAFQANMGAFALGSYPHPAAANTASWSFAIGDIDGNGHRDMIYGGGSGATFIKAADDGLTYSTINVPQYIFCQRTNFVDLNNDGNLDAFSCHDVDANVGFINDGNGNLTFTQGGYGTTCGNYGSIFTDMDNDGSMDLFVAKCGCDPNDLMMPNDGNGVFTNIAPGQGLADTHQSWSSAWGDFDNDGDMDVLIGSSSSGYQKLLRNVGGGNFQNAITGSGMDTFTGQSIEWTAHDFNNDGWIDILGGGAIHYNNGDWTFSHDATAPGNFAIGDMNNDGFLDILTGSGYNANGGNDNHWIRINPIGTTSNRDAIGARVIITSAMGTQIRDIRSGDGFRYMSFIGAHFGLGTDDAVETVEIHWPSGAVEVFHDLAVDQSHQLTEGVSIGVPETAMTEFGVFPNPATDRITVSGVDLNTSVEVFDMAGKRVIADRINGTMLNVANLPSGIYELRVVDKTGAHVKRFTKQ